MPDQPTDSREAGRREVARLVNAFQTRRYGFSASHPVAVLSNFDTTIVYRTVEPPRENDEPRTGVVARYTFEELLTKFDEIFDTLSREASYGNGFDRAFAPDAPP